MNKRRIILTNGSHLLRSMLKRVIDRSEGFQVVKELHELGETRQAIVAHSPDWVIVCLPSGEQVPDIIGKLLQEHPEVRWIAVSEDGGHVKMKWMQAHEVSLDGLSFVELLSIMKDEKEAIPGELRRP